MFEATVLLISSDPALVRVARREVQLLENVRLRVIESIDGADAHAGAEGIGLIVVHLDRGVDDAQVARLLWLASTARRRIPVLAVSERYDPEQALALFRMGVADYLCRPLHLDRLAGFIDQLALRAQRVTSNSGEIGAKPRFRLWDVFTTVS
jgi:DNA-binding NtrC family response regulator